MQHSRILSTTYLRVFHKIVIDRPHAPFGAVSGAGLLLAIADLQSLVLAKIRAAAL
jgi:hypothetical protein